VHDLVDQPAHRGLVGERIEAAAAHELAHLGLDRVHRCYHGDTVGPD
jgi:hypothetical protein